MVTVHQVECCSSSCVSLDNSKQYDDQSTLRARLDWTSRVASCVVSLESNSSAYIQFFGQFNAKSVIFHHYITLASRDVHFSCPCRHLLSLSWIFSSLADIKLEDNNVCRWLSMYILSAHVRPHQFITHTHEPLPQPQPSELRSPQHSIDDADSARNHQDEEVVATQHIDQSAQHITERHSLYQQQIAHYLFTCVIVVALSSLFRRLQSVKVTFERKKWFGFILTLSSVGPLIATSITNCCRLWATSLSSTSYYCRQVNFRYQPTQVHMLSLLQSVTELNGRLGSSHEAVTCGIVLVT